MTKTLLLVTKILQCTASGNEYEPTKPHSPLIDKFISQGHEEMLQSTKELLV